MTKFTITNNYFIGIALLHLLLVIVNIVVYDYQQVSDELKYLRLADEFAAFQWISDSPGIACNTAPGYPLFLGFFKLITQHNKFVIAILQSALYCFSLYFLLRTLLRKDILSKGLVAMSYAFVLCSPEIFESNGLTLTESLCGSLLLLLSGLLLCSTSVKKNILFAVALTLLILTKFEYLALLPLVGLVLLYQKKYKLVAVSGTLLILMLLGNGYRNYNNYNIFNPFSYGGGTVIYGGNNLNGDGSWHKANSNLNYLPKDRVDDFKEILSLEATESCIALDAFYKELAVAAWEKDASLQLQTIPLKFMKLWLVPAGIHIYPGQQEFVSGLQLDTLFNNPDEPWYTSYKNGFYLLVYWSYLILILIGFFLKKKTRKLDYKDYYVGGLFLLLSLIYSLPFYGLGRFHVPIFGLLALYGSYTLEAIWFRWKRSRIK